VNDWQENYFGSLGADPVETPIVWTPGALQQRAVSLHTAMLAFNNDMAKAKLPKGQEGQLPAWRLFRDDWVKWYSNVGALTWLSPSTSAILDSYEKSLAGWREWYAKTIATPSGQGPTQYRDTPLIPSSFTVSTPDIPKAAETVKETPTWAYFVGAAAAGLLGYYLIKKGGGLGDLYPGAQRLFGQGGQEAYERERRKLLSARKAGYLTPEEYRKLLKRLETDWATWEKGGGGLGYPGSTELFSRRGKKGLWSEKQYIRAMKKMGSMTVDEAEMAERDLEHDWFHFTRNQSATTAPPPPDSSEFVF
jgi:hypothetical protein